MRKENAAPSPSKPNGESNPNPNPNPNPEVAAALAFSAMSIDGKEEDDALASSEFLSREEVLRRRSRRLKQLNRCYQRQYWALMEEIRVKHRDYYWEFGKSPFEEDSAEGENGSSSRDERKRCAFIGCKSKAMPLTTFCHPHILYDTKQVLYKACNYVIKRVDSSEGSSASSLVGRDPCWAFGEKVSPNDTNRIRCIYCKQVVNGGITRLKFHLVGVRGNVKACLLVPLDVKEKVEGNLNSAQATKKGKSARLQTAFEEVVVGGVEGDKEEETQRIKNDSTNNGPQICSKPVLRAASPSLCTVHFQRSQRQLSQALKKAGLNPHSHNKPLPKLSVLISECVRQIQAKRRRKSSRKAHTNNVTDKDENC